MAQIRLQTYLARCGVASRRAAEKHITDGQVSVNGKVVRELGTKVDPKTDSVTFEGKRLVLQDHVWLVLHKPPQSVCTAQDPEGRQTVLDLVHMPGTRLYPVGRLDYHTSGVLILTNDGPLAQRLMHPSHEIPRIYHVKVAGLLGPQELDRLGTGVTLEDGTRVKAKATLLASTGKHTWVEMTLHQGLNRQIHRMFEAIERRVLRLIRVEFAGIRADDLPPARYRELTQSEVNGLRERCGLGRQTSRAKPPPTRRTPRKAPRPSPPKAPRRRR